MDGSNDEIEVGRERVEAVERAIVLLQCFEEPGEALHVVCAFPTIGPVQKHDLAVGRFAVAYGLHG